MNDRIDLPGWLADRVYDASEVHRAVLRSGMTIGSGLATSEPVTFYAGLWDAIVAMDLRDLEIRNGLFLNPHPVIVGDAAEPVELPELPSLPDVPGPFDDLARGALGRLVDRVVRPLGDRAQDAVQLRRLARHVERLDERGIVFRSAFLGPALQTFVPDNAVTRLLAPRLAGRNRVTAGLVRYQPVHFPDAAAALAFDLDGALDVDLVVQPMTWPRDGRISFGLSNGVNGEVAARLLSDRGLAGDTTLVLYLNRRLPFTHGPGNTFAVDDLRPLADAGRLFVVVEDVEPPGLPRGAFDDPSDVELAIATNLADHVAANVDLLQGRALQVGIGQVSVQAVRAIADAGAWTGRAVTELLDPLTYELLDRGIVEGPVRCTFAMGEQGSDFCDRLDGDERVQMERASTLMVPATFEGGFGINNVLEVDLAGNVNATAHAHHPWSAVGGLATIMRGLAVGGVAYLCMKSTHKDLDGDRVSAVRPALEPGTPVTITGADLMGTRDGARVFLVTEHGVAQVNARPHDELVRSLLSVAHPDHRDDLAAVAWDRYRVRAG